MTEELVEKLTPSKEMEERDVEERNKILEGVGEVCMAQREYHLATKKFTQCGNRAKVSQTICFQFARTYRYIPKHKHFDSRGINGRVIE